MSKKAFDALFEVVTVTIFVVLAVNSRDKADAKKVQGEKDDSNGKGPQDRNGTAGREGREGRGTRG